MMYEHNKLDHTIHNPKRVVGIWEKIVRFIKISIFFGTVVFFVLALYFNFRPDSNFLNANEQIDLIVKSVQQVYENSELPETVDGTSLMSAGILPLSMLGKDNHLKHIFGGNIVVQSLPKEGYLIIFEQLKADPCAQLANLKFRQWVKSVQIINQEEVKINRNHPIDLVIAHQFCAQDQSSSVAWEVDEN